MKEYHYREVAKWFKEGGLLILGGLVVQRLFVGSALSDPAVISAVVVAVFAYLVAFALLLRS